MGGSTVRGRGNARRRSRDRDRRPADGSRLVQLASFLVATVVADRVARRAAPTPRARQEPEKAGGLRVGILSDWTERPRGNFWSEALGRLEQKVSTRVVHYPLANRLVGKPVVGPADGSRDGDDGDRFFVEDCDILILNWDVANGDPDFGADFVQRWFLHRRREILLWVEDGGLLVIEGQAVLGAPSQQTYDALLGPGEVRVSRPENEVAPQAEWRRSGSRCKTTRRARTSRIFREVPNPVVDQARSFDEMFPPRAQRALTPRIRRDTKDLYRGWFTWNPLRRTELPWVPVLKTGDRRFDHPTMLVAKHGDGAIVATTLYLAGARQEALIEALLRARRHASALPDRPRRFAFVQSVSTRVVVALAAGSGLAATFSGVLGEGWVFESLVTTLVVALVGVAVALLFQGPRLVRRVAREIFGW